MHSKGRLQQLGDDVPSNYETPFSGRQSRGSLVEIASNMDKDSITTGGTRLTQFVAERPQSTEIVVNSADRIRGTPFNFSVELGAPLYRPRLVKLESAIIPRTFNITPKNNRIIVSTFYTKNSDLSTPYFTNPNFSAGFGGSKAFEIELPPGFYGVNSFSSMFRTKMSSALMEAWYVGGAYTSAGKVAVHVDFNEATNQFSFYYDMLAYKDEAGVGVPSDTYQWFWVWSAESSFVKRGRNFVPIQEIDRSLPYSASGNDPFQRSNTTQLLSFFAGEDILPGLSGGVSNLAKIIHSGASAFVYSRFISIRSQALYQYAYSSSRSSNKSYAGNVVATLETVSQDGLSGSGQVYGVHKEISGPVLSVLNPQKQLNDQLDFEFVDEYGDNLDELYPIGVGGTGPTLWFTVSF